MPVNVPDNLPAIDVLKNEKIFVMPSSKAVHQDIRPVKVCIFNIMPVKETTETHILRLLSNTPLQIEIELLRPKEHFSQNTSDEHLNAFYKTFDEIKEEKFDGMIITGAPVGLLDFEQVTYWKEMQRIMDWTVHHVTSTLYICWGALAGLYHFYGIPKHILSKKMFGVFMHTINDRTVPLVRGFDDVFPAPHSRHTEVRHEDIRKYEDLMIVSESERAGVYIVQNKNGRQVFVTGHSEYDPDTLKREYERDMQKGANIEIPRNYFAEDNPQNPPIVRWRSHANLLFTNWLNYYVYQATPYDLNLID